METQKVKNNKSIALVSASIAIGVIVAFAIYFVYVSVQPTIYDKLTEVGITYFLSHWEPFVLDIAFWSSIIAISVVIVLKRSKILTSK